MLKHQESLINFCIDVLIQSLKLSSSSSSRSRSSKSSPRSKSSLSFPYFDSRFVSFSRGFSGLVSGSISPAVTNWFKIKNEIQKWDGMGLTIKFLEIAEKCPPSSLWKTLKISLKVGLLLLYLTLPWPRKVDKFSWTKLYTTFGTFTRLLHTGRTSVKSKSLQNK